MRIDPGAALFPVHSRNIIGQMRIHPIERHYVEPVNRPSLKRRE